MPRRRRLIVGITGATGIAYAVRLLELLREAGVETHLVVSRAGDMTRAHETALSARQLRDLADVTYGHGDVAAAISSGSFPTAGMVVVPCSVKTLAEIAGGLGQNLISRAADVILKERRRLVLVLRETPLNLIHLRNMVTVTEAGAIVMPPVPAFYTMPNSIDEMVDHTVRRCLDLFDIELAGGKRWGEDIDIASARDRSRSNGRGAAHDDDYD
jgi:4-hydroxy-3-polyprenylbenzoate decarboxylase